MKKLLFAMLFAVMLLAMASPLRAQTYYGSEVDLLNFIYRKVDSLYASSFPVGENITAVDGLTIPASGQMTFPIPLIPVGDHKSMTWTITCTGTPPDTLYYEIVAAQTMMDSLTVLNLGTVAIPNPRGYIAYPFDAMFGSTGMEIPISANMQMLSNAKYVGIRFQPDDSRAVTVKAVCNLK